MTVLKFNTNNSVNQALIPFDFAGMQVRTIMKDGKPWFVAKDVCSVLGFANHRTAVDNHLDEDEKGVLSADTLGGSQKLLSVDESGLFALIFKSPKPEARPFRKWVTSEVLPTLRKTGKYEIQNTTPTLPKVTEDLIALGGMAEFFGITGNQAKLSANMAIKKLYDIDCMGTLEITGLISETQKQHFTPTILGKKIGLSAAKLNKELESHGLQECLRDHKNRIIWQVTNKGLNYCMVIDTGKVHKESGAPVEQLKWCDDVISLIEQPIA